MQRVHLDIQVGEHAIDYANVAQKEKLSELQLRIRQLLDQVGQITKEQNYQRVQNAWFLSKATSLKYRKAEALQDYYVKLCFKFFSIGKNVLGRHLRALIAVYSGGL